jgi:glycerophosphoryl diester phosphodiesterase
MNDPQPNPAAPVGGVRIAHRGCSGEYGDNTAAAFAAAIGGGHAIETDVRMTEDGVLVLVHDETVGGVPVERLIFDRLCELDPQVVALRSLLHRCSGGDVLLVLEVKYRGVRRVPGAIEQAVIDELGQAGRLGSAADGLTVVSSFSPACLLEFEERDETIPRLQILESLRCRPIQEAVAATDILEIVRDHTVGIAPDVTDLERVPWMRLAGERGLGVFPYPPETIQTRDGHREATEIIIGARCDGGHFNYPEMYGPAPASDPTPTQTMRGFLAAQERKVGLRSVLFRNRGSVARLAAQLVMHGDGRELSTVDLYNADGDAGLSPNQATNLQTRCAHLIAERLK